MNKAASALNDTVLYNITKCAVLLISAVIFLSAFYFPEWCAEGSFIFLFPFLAYASDNRPLQLHLFSMWAFIVGGVLTHPLCCYMLFQIPERRLIERLVICVGIITYYSGSLILLYCAFIWIAARAHFLRQKGKLITVCGLLLGFVCISTSFLRPWGSYFGCILYNPLLPLMTRSYGRLWVQFFGHTFGLILLWLLVGGSMCVQKKRGLVWSVILLTLFAAVELWYWQTMSANTHAVCSQFHFVKGRACKHDTAYGIFNSVMDDIDYMMTYYSTKKWVLCFPESFFSYPFNAYPAFEQAIKATLQKGQAIILGTYQQQGDQLLNCLYLIEQSGSTIYYKQTLVPCVEYPLYINAQDSSVYFSPGFIEQQSFLIADYPINPLICAELYICTELQCDMLHVVILNDSWCKGSFFPQLMVLAAILKACSHNAALLYSSYEFCCLIEQNGKCIDFSSCYAN